MLTKQQLEEIAERVDKATEGPWGIADTSDGAWIVDEYGDIITGTTERLPDATFIANAREDIPKLLEHIAEQEAEIERLRNRERGATELYKIALWTTRRKKEYQHTLESVQEELWYALHSNKDDDDRWFYVTNAERFIKEVLHD